MGSQSSSVQRFGRPLAPDGNNGGESTASERIDRKALLQAPLGEVVNIVDINRQLLCL
jgi:hypothetical protein